MKGERAHTISGAQSGVPNFSVNGRSRRGTKGLEKDVHSSDCVATNASTVISTNVRSRQTGLAAKLKKESRRDRDGDKKKIVGIKLRTSKLS